jgi:2',3'-cyclic-nucleotide 2'-phosphodiesterase (5'-nucleotidase family)
MALAESLKADADHALFVGNGDDLAPSVLSGVFFGEHMIDAFNVSPLDFNTYGNHEFDYGPDNLAELVADSEFQWVSANVVDNRTGDVFAAEQGAERFEIRDYGGVQVGVTGLGPKDMASVTNMGDHAVEIPAAEAMTAVVPMMREAGADVIVVGSHLCGPDARELAAGVDGIDVIVGDHCSEVLDEPEVINDTIVSFVGDEFDFLGELTLQVGDGQIEGFDFVKHDVAEAGVEPHPQVQAVVERYQEQLDEELAEVIGERAVEWDNRRETVRNQEAAFGNLVSDAMAELHEADFAFTNGGGIRGDQVYGADEPITRFEIVENLPFPNTVVKAAMPGEMLRDVLEHAVAGLPGAGQFLQVSGVEYTYDASREPGDRIVAATVGCDPIVDDAEYTFATNDFLLDGGDGYEMLTDADVLVPGHEGPLMSGFIMDHVEKAGVIDTDVEGRITRVGTDDESLLAAAPGPEVEELLDDPDVVSAEPDARVYAAVTPNDPHYQGSQRAYLESINVPEAWELAVGREEIVVAVVDTGVDISHPARAPILRTRLARLPDTKAGVRDELLGGEEGPRDSVWRGRSSLIMTT